jgi:hypothetical protein
LNFLNIVNENQKEQGTKNAFLKHTSIIHPKIAVLSIARNKLSPISKIAMKPTSSTKANTQSLQFHQQKLMV